MSVRKNILVIITLVAFLLIFSFIFIMVNGKSYTYVEDIDHSISQIDELDIELEGDSVEIVSQKISDGKLIVKLRSVHSGLTYLNVKKIDDNNSLFMRRFYVHSFGIITCDYFLGDSNGGWIVPLTILILFLSALYFVISRFKINIKENMYQYINITYFGIIIFFTFVCLNLLYIVFHYRGLFYMINDTIDLYSKFSFILLPIAFLVSIFVTISNIVLIMKEGRTWRNLLGLILGLFFCLMTIFPSLLGDYFQTATWIDVHNERGAALYIEKFVETFIFSLVAYLECVLLATIFMSVRAARHIPKYDKDYIIILGCMIRKDGTLTNLLKSRVDRAIEFRNKQLASTGKDLIFVPSGGKGNDEIISEGIAMKKYLLSKGIKDNHILLEDRSKNTYENIKFSHQLIQKKKNGNIAFSTTNYHVFRAGNIAFKQNIYIEGIGATTKAYFWLNAFIREYVATLYSEKKLHIVLMLFISIISITMILLIYFSNIF